MNNQTQTGLAHPTLARFPTAYLDYSTQPDLCLAPALPDGLKPGSVLLDAPTDWSNVRPLISASQISTSERKRAPDTAGIYHI